MLIEIIIMLELIAFAFLALGIAPFKNTDDNSPPLLNRVIFIIISLILFASLALTTVQYDYTYCYINETISDFTTNITTTDATCANWKIESLDLSNINWGLSILCGLLVFVLIIIMGFSNKGRKNDFD